MSCTSCAQTNTLQRFPIGKLMPLPSLQCLRSHKTLDFITDLTKSTCNMVILVIMDQFLCSLCLIPFLAFHRWPTHAGENGGWSMWWTGRVIAQRNSAGYRPKTFWTPCYPKTFTPGVWKNQAPDSENALKRSTPRVSSSGGVLSRLHNSVSQNPLQHTVRADTNYNSQQSA